jgi:YidC/Oxa1 family membrane protein insertase
MSMMNEQNGQMHPDDKRNMLMFAIAAIAVWLVFDHFLLQPKMEEMRTAVAQQEEAAKKSAAQGGIMGGGDMGIIRPRQEVLSETTRLTIENDQVKGSLALIGGRLDDLSLKNYFHTLEKKRNITLLSPSETEYTKYFDFGWLSSNRQTILPGQATRWYVQGENRQLAPGKNVVLAWNNGQGLHFEREYSLDENYMVTLTRRVRNTGGENVTLYPYGMIAEFGLPETYEKRHVVHEGPIGYIGDELIEIPYHKAHKKDPLIEYKSDHGWIGITQRYWFTSMYTEDAGDKKFRFSYQPASGVESKEKYQVDMRGAGQLLKPGGEVSSTLQIYAGAKKLPLLEQYEKDHEIKHFDLAVDFGMFYFLTKPFFHILMFNEAWTGNFGIAIILLTVLVRLLVFPLANTSYKSFAGLRKIAPKMTELREKYGDDKEQLQQALVKLYETEKVNPMAGCLPILIQIPIFFALFKVLNVAIEMRHEPFFGWIKDLAAQDPTTIFNLFGLLPFTPPSFLMIGAWPCLMLVFMLIQKQMNPPAQDKTQAMMMNFMPFMMTFILSKFAAGLVIYWTFSNALSVVQQYVIMRNMGVEVKFWHSKEDKEMEKAVAEGPSVHPELGVIEDEVEEALFGDDHEGKEAKPVSAPKKKKGKKVAAKKAASKKTAAKKAKKKS